VKDVKLDKRAAVYSFLGGGEGGEEEEEEGGGSRRAVASRLPSEEYISGNMYLGRTHVPISNPRDKASSRRLDISSAIGGILFKKLPSA